MADSRDAKRRRPRRSPQHTARRRATRTQARKIQRRLDRVQRERATRERQSLRGQISRHRERHRIRSLLLFAVPAAIGLAMTAPSSWAWIEALHWFGEETPTLERVAVLGHEQLASREVADATGVRPGTALAAISTDEIRQQLVLHPWIRDARVALVPAGTSTGTLVVEIVERDAHALLRGPGGKTRFVDIGGAVFGDADSRRATRAAANMPLLVTDEANVESLGESLDLADVLAARALTGLARPATRHRGLELLLPRDGSDEGWIVRGDGAPLRVILGKGSEMELTARVDRLDGLLTEQLPEVGRARAIDLRFAGQAVLRGVDTAPL